MSEEIDSWGGDEHCRSSSSLSLNAHRALLVVLFLQRLIEHGLAEARGVSPSNAQTLRRLSSDARPEPSRYFDAETIMQTLDHPDAQTLLDFLLLPIKESENARGCLLPERLRVCEPERLRG